MSKAYFTDDMDAETLKAAEAMEAEFTKVFNEHHPEIQAKLAQAVKLITEAEALADKHGIPFRPEDHIMFCKPSYLPESMKEKFPGLDMEFIMDLTEAYGDENYPGWQLSQTC